MIPLVCVLNTKNYLRNAEKLIRHFYIIKAVFIKVSYIFKFYFAHYIMHFAPYICFISKNSWTSGQMLLTLLLVA